MSEKVFVDSSSVRKVSDTLFGLSFNAEKLIDFATAYKNEKGYLNLNMCQSKDGKKWYLELNTWQPQKKKQEVIDDDEIPF